MAEKINDLIVEALDILVASANKSPAELILYKRCSMTFKEVNTPVFSVTDLKGLKYFSSFILENIYKILQNNINQSKASTVKRKLTEHVIETEKGSIKKRKNVAEKKSQEDSGHKCHHCEESFSRREHIKRHLGKGSCKALTNIVNKDKESAQTNYFPNKRVPEGSPGFAALKALFLGTDNKKSQ